MRRLVVLHGISLVCALPLMLLAVSVAVASPSGVRSLGEPLLELGIGVGAPVLLLPQVALAACLLGCLELGLYGFTRFNPLAGLRAVTLLWGAFAVALFLAWVMYAWADLLVLAAIQVLCCAAGAHGWVQLSALHSRSTLGVATG